MRLSLLADGLIPCSRLSPKMRHKSLEFPSSVPSVGHHAARSTPTVLRYIVSSQLILKPCMHLPPIICSPREAGNPGDNVAILPTSSNFCAILREMQRNPPEFEQNMSLQMFHCACGEYVQVTLTAQCAAGDILVPGLFGDPKIFVQFDGSAHHDVEVGGAGAGLFEISAQGMSRSKNR